MILNSSDELITKETENVDTSHTNNQIEAFIVEARRNSMEPKMVQSRIATREEMMQQQPQPSTSRGPIFADEQRPVRDVIRDAERAKIFASQGNYPQGQNLGVMEHNPNMQMNYMEHAPSAFVDEGYIVVGLH